MIEVLYIICTCIKSIGFCAFQMHLLVTVELQIRQNVVACFYNIPNRGTKRSLTGNKVFPSWESIVPLLGTFFTCFDEDFVVLKM